MSEQEEKYETVLTDEEIRAVLSGCPSSSHNKIDFARAIEKAVILNAGRTGFWGGLCARLLKERDEARARIEELEKAMQLFVDRVGCGEVRSKKTYAQFKELLKAKL